MKKKFNWFKFFYAMGVILFLIGTLDPLEGSVLIALGSMVLVAASRYKKDRHYKAFRIHAMLIIIGVFFLFYFSSLGGFGGTSSLSWWWGILIIPYPLGWLMNVILLLKRAFYKNKGIGDP